jgi:polyisoprenoid-binding protein YceI
MMVSKVRGSFERFSGQISIAPEPADSTASVEVDVSTIRTMNVDRDAHLKSADYFETEKFPTASFVSRQVVIADAEITLVGDLTIHGVTQSTEFQVEYLGAGNDPWGGYRAGFSATALVSRKDFGMDSIVALDTGGVLVGDRITLELEIQAVHQAEAPA